MVSLHLRVHYSDRDSLSRSIKILVTVCAVLFFTTSVTPRLGMNISSYLSGIGLLGYSMALFYELSKFFKNKGVVIFFNFIIALLFLMLIISLLAFDLMDKTALGDEMAGIMASLFFIAAPLLAWDRLHSGIKIKNKKGVMLLVLGLMFFQQVLALNPFDLVDSAGSIINAIKNASGSDQGFIDSQKQLLTGILNSGESSGLILLAVFLVVFYLVLKFIAAIIKWVIVLIILGVVLMLFSSGAPVDVSHLLKLI